MTYEQRIREYYEGTLATGKTEWGRVGWGSEEGQRQRYSVLYSLVRQVLPQFGPYQPSLLEVGCGHSLYAGSWTGEYVGVDLVPQMIEIAEHSHVMRRLHDGHHRLEVRDILKQPFDRKFDAVIASGIFGLDVCGGPGTRVYVDQMIKAMWDHCTKVCAFNMLSLQLPLPEQQEGDLYFRTTLALEIAMRHTPFVKLDHSYRRNDFTIAMYREQQAA